MINFRTTTLTIATAVIAGAAFLPAPAQAASAGTAWVEYGTVQYTAGAGAVNAVTLTRSGRTVTIDDRVGIKAGRGCAAVPGDHTKVRCTTPSTPLHIAVRLGDKNDLSVNKTAVS